MSYDWFNNVYEDDYDSEYNQFTDQDDEDINQRTDNFINEKMKIFISTLKTDSVIDRTCFKLFSEIINESINENINTVRVFDSFISYIEADASKVINVIFQKIMNKTAYLDCFGKVVSYKNLIEQIEFVCSANSFKFSHNVVENIASYIWFKNNAPVEYKADELLNVIKKSVLHYCLRPYLEYIKHAYSSFIAKRQTMEIKKEYMTAPETKKGRTSKVRAEFYDRVIHITAKTLEARPNISTHSLADKLSKHFGVRPSRETLANWIKAYRSENKIEAVEPYDKEKFTLLGVDV
ncbi:helix-turn-helix domain-containing protein [Salmonella enterica]|nr:helix-turn-helix domain-containing protein [Salmonella enterica subsp. enterica serovar Antsalova]EFQ6722140.1 helix-turn-helix domain-containing protein [Salmonella enterica]EGK7840458.1 helix-turn-helix domain-containing protein [Salmonella enterica]